MPFLAGILAILLASIGIANSSDASTTRSSTPHGELRVVATTGMLADLVRGVAGADTDTTVEALIAPGVDPHLHKPTRSDLATILGADVIVANGLHLEGRMTESLERARKSGRTVLEIGPLVPPKQLLTASEDGGPTEPDPHLWMDPRLWSETVAGVAEAIATNDPGNAERYRSNAEAHRQSLLDLDAWSAERLATVPAEHRVLVTAHDAFEYFGRRYGFEVVGIQGISTESEAGVRDIERIVDLLVERRIPAVFVESTVPPRHVQALVAGARARGHEVRVGGELFSDAMGPVGTYEGTYPGMIDHNVTTIVRALGGDAPARGRLGRLGGERKE